VAIFLQLKNLNENVSKTGMDLSSPDITTATSHTERTGLVNTKMLKIKNAAGNGEAGPVKDGFTPPLAQWQPPQHRDPELD